LSYLANTQTDRQTDKVWQKHYLLGGGNDRNYAFCNESVSYRQCATVNGRQSPDGAYDSVAVCASRVHDCTYKLSLTTVLLLTAVTASSAATAAAAGGRGNTAKVGLSASTSVG